MQVHVHIQVGFYKTSFVVVYIYTYMYMYVCIYTTEEGGATGLKAMWDSMVCWMKMAVDFVALDRPVEAEPCSTPSPGRVS